jgi:hypothetical protein
LSKQIAVGFSKRFCRFRRILVTDAYVHGYDSRENRRLQDQADTLAELLHHDTAYPAGSVVLEAGCGVGAQTVTPAAGIVDEGAFDKGIRDLYRTAKEEGALCYTFFKAVGVK